MPITFVLEENSNSDDLPWAKDYVEETGDSDTIVFVTEIKKGAKGYLLISKLFKAFIFGGSNQWNYITEAIPAWKAAKNLPYSVMMSVNEKGKVNIGVDDEMESTAYVDKKGNVTFKKVKEDISSQPQATNPFLSPTLPFTSSSGSDRIEKSSISSKTKKML